MTRLQKAFSQDKKLLSIYFTAGYPGLDDTAFIISELEKNGVDMIEIGLPFSDPLADGPVIQNSSAVAIDNGMTARLLFGQLQHIRKHVNIPLVIMGYFNPILQFGVEEFCRQCQICGIDGLIIPDLPADTYESEYKNVFQKYNLANIFLITRQTSDSRIRYIDAISNSFIYLVSSSAITGSQNTVSEEQQQYFERIAQMKLRNPVVVGFGIHDKPSFEVATGQAAGAIIGSAFIKHLAENGLNSIATFISQFTKTF